MGNLIQIRTVIVVVALFFVSGCNGYERTSDPERMHDIASNLKDVATSVDGLVKFGNGQSLSESELLLEAVDHDKSRLRVFDGFELHVRRVGKNSSLLLCKGDQAIIEDTGCTPQSDLNYWQIELKKPCNFTIELLAVCN